MKRPRKQLHVVVSELPREGGGYIPQRSKPMDQQEAWALKVHLQRGGVRADVEPATAADFEADKRTAERRRENKAKQGGGLV